MPDLTDHLLKQLKTQAIEQTKAIEIGDGICKGLRVRASYGGAVSFYLSFRRKDDSGKPVDILEIDGSVTPDHAAKLMETIWQHLPGEHPLPADQFGEYQDQGVAKHSDPLAITQLLLTYHLLREYRDSGSGEQIFARPVAAESRLRKRQPAIEKEEV